MEADAAQQVDSQHPAQTRISVVVPSYNHARFVGDCLRSIFKQTLRPQELLVIDDGSSDGSPAVIGKVLGDCPFPCEFIARENRGLCATLNEGLARTGGEYFAYLGSDDVWLAEFLNVRVAMLASRTQAVLGYGHTHLIDDENRIVDSTELWARYADGDARQMLLGGIAPMSPSVVHRRSAIERHAWREGARLEDYELYLKLSRDGEFAFGGEPLSAWRMHGTNSSWNQMMMLEEVLAAQREFLCEDGWTASEIENLARRLRFERAEDFLRLGDRRTALRLVLKNALGARGSARLPRILLRLALPLRLFERRKARARQAAFARYGSVEI